MSGNGLSNLSVALLHEHMLDKQGLEVVTSLTLLDLHDIARSCRTFGTATFFIAHPSEALRKLAATLQTHWEKGFGSTYNPDRKEALSLLRVLPSLEEVRQQLIKTHGTCKLIGTSAKSGQQRISFREMTDLMRESDQHYLLLLGTGWGMSDGLLEQVDYFLEPIYGPSDYNHLSVRSACAIMLDRLANWP